MSDDDEIFKHFNVRCDPDLYDKARADAKKKGQTLAEWVRRAMVEKLERENNYTDSELEYVIVRTIQKMKEEKKI